MSFRNSADRQVSAVVLSPSVPTTKIVILCHGFMGYKASWTNRTLSEQLLRLLRQVDG